MLHPSYTDLIDIVNSEVLQGEELLVNSRYSIVLATAKRARQIIQGAESKIDTNLPKPLSIAVQELYESKVKIISEEEFLQESERVSSINEKLLEINEIEEEFVEE